MADVRRVLAKNALLSSVAVYAEYVAAFLVSIIVARRLGPADYGTYTLLMWLVLAGVTVANNGLTTGVMKFIGECRGRRATAPAAAVLSYCERLQIASSALVCACVLLLLILFPRLIASDVQTAVLVTALCCAVAARSLALFYGAAIRGFENFRAAAVVNAVVAPVTVLTALAAASVAGTLVAFLGAYAATSVAAALGLRHAATREAGGAAVVVPPELTRRIRRHVRLASAIVALDLILLRQTEVFFLNYFSTAAAVGYFGLGRSLAASAILLAPGVVTALLVPAMAKTFADDPAAFRGRFLAATRYILLLVVPVVALAELYAADAIVALYGHDYQPAIRVFRVAIAGSAIGVVSASASSYQLGSDRQPVIVAIMSAAAAWTLVLDYLLIRSLGLDGAILAGGLSSITLATALLWHASASLGARFEWNTYARIVCAGAIAVVPAAGLRYVLPFWAGAPIGVTVAISLYAVLSIVMGAWTQDDLVSMQPMAELLPLSLQRRVKTLLYWAAARSSMTAEHI